MKSCLSRLIVRVDAVGYLEYVTLFAWVGGSKTAEEEEALVVCENSDGDLS